VTLDDSITQFRVASRELFNKYFRADVSDPREGWILDERFCEVEAVLFNEMVVEPHDLPTVRYGAQQPSIVVSLRRGGFAPIMINREVDSGYWDFPLKEFTADAKFSLIRFFDWDILGVRDNQYVRVSIVEWPGHPEVIGKHALIETQSVTFSKRT